MITQMDQLSQHLRGIKCDHVKVRKPGLISKWRWLRVVREEVRKN